MTKMLQALTLMWFGGNAYAFNADFFFKDVKHEKSSELAYYLDVWKECSITKREVIEVIDEVFLKMGVKPLGEDAHLNADLYLNVILSCVHLEPNSLYRMEIRFGQNDEKPTIRNWDFGEIGIDSPTKLIKKLEHNVKEAMKVYIQANFNL
jgi:hypothetical protein